ncbi:hypothetical protein [Streptomyces sp. NBC_00038]|uniref:hypothetical protein n=1 Tax=Streptomyces sp. NBC_00038 TaxID=2903615 RepID=UPI00225A7F62|nr:hypothetical protein [Streptomyces sp. NBC_00038]MCX5562863.1 hypothetical protein [Streptomyces sp. NBC_00038]
MGADVGVASIGSGSDQVEDVVDVFHHEQLAAGGVGRLLCLVENAVGPHLAGQ